LPSKLSQTPQIQISALKVSLLQLPLLTFDTLNLVLSLVENIDPEKEPAVRNNLK
jgi:hypothetical protein